MFVMGKTKRGVTKNFISVLVGADSFVLPEEKRKKFCFSPSGATGNGERTFRRAYESANFYVIL